MHRSDLSLRMRGIPGARDSQRAANDRIGRERFDAGCTNACRRRGGVDAESRQCFKITDQHIHTFLIIIKSGFNRAVIRVSACEDWSAIQRSPFSLRRCRPSQTARRTSLLVAPQVQHCDGWQRASHFRGSESEQGATETLSARALDNNGHSTKNNCGQD